MLARFYTVTSCRTSGLRFGKHPFCFPEMIVHLRCGDVNGLKNCCRSKVRMSYLGKVEMSY